MATYFAITLLFQGYYVLLPMPMSLYACFVITLFIVIYHLLMPLRGYCCLRRRRYHHADIYVITITPMSRRHAAAD